MSQYTTFFLGRILKMAFALKQEGETILVCALVLLVVSDLMGVEARRDWWPTTTNDVKWVNRPLAEIKAASVSGDSQGQYYYARACFLGQEGRLNLAQVFQWTRRSAEQGYAPAQYILARLYFLGWGTGYDPTEAVNWVNRAAKQGHVDAMGLLGQVFEYGAGMPRNATNALNWLQRAVNGGSDVALVWMGNFYINGEAGTANPTNYAVALHWFERAATNGSTSAALKAADMYRRGFGSPPDFTRALRWIHYAADHNDPRGCELLAELCSSRMTEVRNFQDNPTDLLSRAACLRFNEFLWCGAQLWELSSSFDLTKDCEALWSRYRFGLGTPRDYMLAATWMWVAYQEDRRCVAVGKRSWTGVQGNAPNPFEYILRGELPPDSYFKAGKLPTTTEDGYWQQAVQLVQDALVRGQPAVHQVIGEHYRDGSKFTPQDSLRAWAWFSRAASLGHAAAWTAQKDIETKLTAEDLLRAKQIWIPTSLTTW